MLASVRQEFGRLDALVNNAGITANIAPKDFEAMTAERWDRVFAVNVRGIFQVTRAPRADAERSAGKHRQYRQHRRPAPGPQPLPYAASKAAVDQPDQAAGTEPCAGNSRQRRCPGLD